jgi:hypothetical protein
MDPATIPATRSETRLSSSMSSDDPLNDWKSLLGPHFKTQHTHVNSLAVNLLNRAWFQNPFRTKTRFVTNTISRLKNPHFYTTTSHFNQQTLPTRLILFPNNNINNSIQKHKFKSVNIHITFPTTSTTQTTTKRILFSFRN